MLLLADTITFLITALIVNTITSPPRPGTPPTSPWTVLRSWSFLLASGSQVMLALNTVVLTLMLPLWIITRTTAPPATISALLRDPRPPAHVVILCGCQRLDAPRVASPCLATQGSSSDTLDWTHRRDVRVRTAAR